MVDLWSNATYLEAFDLSDLIISYKHTCLNVFF